MSWKRGRSLLPRKHKVFYLIHQSISNFPSQRFVCNVAFYYTKISVMGLFLTWWICVILNKDNYHHKRNQQQWDSKICRILMISTTLTDCISKSEFYWRIHFYMYLLSIKYIQKVPYTIKTTGPPVHVDVLNSKIIRESFIRHMRSGATFCYSPEKHRYNGMLVWFWSVKRRRLTVIPDATRFSKRPCPWDSTRGLDVKICFGVKTLNMANLYISRNMTCILSARVSRRRHTQTYTAFSTHRVHYTHTEATTVFVFLQFGSEWP